MKVELSKYRNDLDPKSLKHTRPTLTFSLLTTIEMILSLYLHFVHQPEPAVFLHLGLELLGKPAVVPHVLLKTGHSEVPDDEPEFE